MTFLAGHVVDLEGRPVAGADVRVTPRPRMSVAIGWREARTHTGTSDADGRFRIELDWEGIAIVRASAPGMCRATAPWAHTGTSTTVAVLEPCGAVSGSVLDPAGTPLPGATVFALRLRMPTESAEDATRQWNSPAALTDDAGLYSLQGLDAGRYALLGTHPEHAQAILAVEVPESGTLRGIDLALGAGHKISGRVIDTSGQPVPETTLLAWPAGSRDLFQYMPAIAEQSAISAADGRFTLRGLRPLDYVIGADHPDYFGASARERLSLPTPAGSENLEIVLQRGLTLRGIAESSTGALLEGVQITYGSRRTESEGDGTFELHGLAPGQANVRGELARHRFANVSVHLEADRQPDPIVLVLEPAPGVPISGRVVTSSGAPMPGVRVMASNSTLADQSGHTPGTVTDENGRFELQGFAPGSSARVGAGARGYARSRVEAQAGAEDVEIVLVAESRISGIVLDPTGAGAAGAQVLLLPRDDPNPRFARTDDAGRFQLKGVAPGHYSIHARWGSAESDKQPLHATLGEELSDLTLQIRGGDGSIRGRVVARASGAGIPRVRVDWSAASGDTSGTAHTADDGSFAIQQLQDGIYSLRLRPPTGYATADGSAEMRKRAQPGGEVVFELVRGLKLHAMVQDASGTPLTQPVRIEVLCDDSEPWRRQAATAIGQVRISGVPPCLRSVTLRAEAYLPETIAVTASAAVDGVLELGSVTLRGGSTLRGTVVDEQGAPVERASVAVEYPGEGASTGPKSRTDASGAFTLSGVASGEVLLRARRRGHVDAVERITVRDGTTREGIVLRLEAGGQIVGLVLSPDGQPVDKARLSARVQEDGRWRTKGSARTEGDGTYRITGLLAGSYRVQLEPPIPLTQIRLDAEPLSPPAQRRLVELAQEGQVRCDFTSETLCRVSGRLTGWNEETARRFGVPTRGSLDGDSGAHEFHIGSDGSFDAGSVLPGRYELRIRRTLRLEVEIPHQVEHQLLLQVPTAELSGTAIAYNGNPATSGRVHLVAPDGTSRSARLDSSGHFGFGFVAAGTYALEWRADDQVRAVLPDIELTAGGIRHDLQLREQ